MNKQEKIREGIKQRVQAYASELRPPNAESYAFADILLRYLHSQGVVIKVNCPKCGGFARPNKVTYSLHEGYTVNGHSCPNCNNTGYVAVEPLIKER